MNNSNTKGIKDKYQDIISSLEEFVYFDSDLTDQIQAWAEINIDKFDCEIYTNTNSIEIPTKTIEHPLHHTTLYNNYCDLFEKVISTFLLKQNISLTELSDAFSYEISSRRRCQQDNSSVSMLTSYVSFDGFCEMMLLVKQGIGVVFCPPLIECDSSDYIAEEKQAYGHSSSSSNNNNNLCYSSKDDCNQVKSLSPSNTFIIDSKEKLYDAKDDCIDSKLHFDHK